MRSWKVLIFAALSVSISGCLSNPTKQLVDKAQPVEELDLYGELTYKDGHYKLSSLFYNAKHQSSQKLNEGVWRFKIPSFEPAFNSKRFTCEKTLTKSQCDNWEDKENLFLYVNFTKSDYGNTPSEKRALQKKKAAEAAKKKPMTTKDMVGTAIAAPVMVGVGALLAYSMIIPGAAYAAVSTAEAVVNPDEALKRNNWVEFHHEKFNEVLTRQINSEYGSIDRFYQKAGELNAFVKIMNRTAEGYEKKIQKNSRQYNKFLASYTHDKAIPSFTFLSAEAELERGIPVVDLQAFQEKQLSRLIEHYEGVLKDQMSFYNQHESKIISAYKKQQRKEYDLASSSVQIDRFIKKYQSLDELDLIPKARIKLKNALAAEEKQRQIAAEKRRLQQQQEQKQLALWRSNIQIGDETFCGPVIDINQSMVKIAVRAQLQGYSNEAWLRRTELFPSSLGCLNRNGTLTPRG